MSGSGWGELGGPTTLTPPSRARRGRRRTPEGNVVFGALLTGANVLGLGLVALMLATTDADAIPPTTEPAATVPDRAPAEEQPRDGGIPTVTTQPHPAPSRGRPARACRCSPRLAPPTALPPHEGG